MSFDNTKRIRAVAIILNGNKVLLMHRIKEGGEYYVFPGGGVEEENIEEAVMREVKEETSLKAQLEKLLYHHIYEDINNEQFYYLRRYISGKPKS